MINLILCGGSGTRLWPLSRVKVPKQFIKLFNHHSLFQLTQSRNAQFSEKTIAVVNDTQFLLAYEQSDNVNQMKFILEPVGRNTAPAIALSCFGLEYNDIVLVTSSDQLIKNQDNYLNMVCKAEKLAEKGFLVTFGLKPKYPETGFGYIETLDEENVLTFREKPDFDTAKKYVESGRYFWNCGIFCFKAGVFLEELLKYSPDIYYKAKEAYEERVINDNIESISLGNMLEIPSDSIDYAVMEKSDKIKVICGDLGWSDIGSFDSLEKEFAKNQDSNNQIEHHISISSSNNFIWSKKKIVTIDVDDLIIVDTDDVLLVVKKGSSQKVKKVVEYLKEIEPNLVN
ncbi:hypothetical protein BBH51_09840 [Aggregatibacter actinomycetemcomitans]|uniref:mannose-1-phosphate guanylyltransferase n=1 Tax=Aggregatibacter actinomycetemcomitans TaxID=714 RepID=Q9JRR7_AGGAC|nr:mannose-1-phosphate guanylyltransferase [Aggregatibacter actinomycetemcomitans]ANU82918.1 hypothetical protein BBH51_09840 [Aggregatibacter actinomycetemcomitans]KYK82415.1 hypothetical protein SA3033_10310 [Aggregatibacter actinomycetemcomitans serotype d str. SA3033]KYK89888.1 hypothetical protein SA2200_01815 [Aggregatibacter actinomycetemcomitans serotype d str. SA2200]MBN6073497.1 mannose-1-phosphate guanylyltransferase [Aggregatibacter actinomycetemcomitans]BAA94400.1 GDP-mannose pyro